MKRLNEKTGKEFKRGDTRDDGYMFIGYQMGVLRKTGYFKEAWVSPEAFEANCVKSRRLSSKWSKANRDKVNAKNRAYAKQYPEKHSKRCCAWKKANPAKHTAAWMKRHAQKLKATPAWANAAKIQQEYELAVWCTQVMGEPYHVDHVIPLQGKTVCGLHVEHNLRVIRGKDNQSKGNRHEA